MACGGSVKKYDIGGAVQSVRQAIKEEEERPFKEKNVGDNLGLAAFRSEVGKNWQTKPMEERLALAAQKSSEARDEARRESTRGIQPKKRGGRVSKKK